MLLTLNTGRGFQAAIGELLELDLIDDADLKVLVLLYGKLVKQDSLSHVYKI